MVGTSGGYHDGRGGRGGRVDHRFCGVGQIFDLCVSWRSSLSELKNGLTPEVSSSLFDAGNIHYHPKGMQKQQFFPRWYRYLRYF